MTYCNFMVFKGGCLNTGSFSGGLRRWRRDYIFNVRLKFNALTVFIFQNMRFQFTAYFHYRLFNFMYYSLYLCQKHLLPANTGYEGAKGGLGGLKSMGNAVSLPCSTAKTANNFKIQLKKFFLSSPTLRHHFRD